MSGPSAQVVAETQSRLESDKECSACSWTKAKQDRYNYSSHVKLFHAASNRGAWAIGLEHILEERPSVRLCHDGMNMTYVRLNLGIPAPTVAKEWFDHSGQYFLLTERIKGENLKVAWPTLSKAQKENIAQQVTNCIHKLRNLRSPHMISLTNGPLDSEWFFLDGGETPHGPIGSDDELAETFASSLKNTPKILSSSLIRRLPVCTPYTLTHGDLSIGNIVVKDGELAGILGWRYAGYFPVWWEYAATKLCFGEKDTEWKALLSARLPPFDQAAEAWHGLLAFSKNFTMDERDRTRVGRLIGDIEKGHEEKPQQFIREKSVD